jgi:hypothetical protein
MLCASAVRQRYVGIPLFSQLFGSQGDSLLG